MITLVLGTIGADIHSVGNKILDYALTEAGFHIVNLGVLVSQEEYINAAIETNADAILISSLYGQAELDCRGMREKCNEAGLGDIPLYIGGNITLGKQEWSEAKKLFEDKYGFFRAYPPGTSIDKIVPDLYRDFNVRSVEYGKATS